MKKMLILFCIVCLLCSCATSGKTEGTEAGAAEVETAEEAPAKKSTLYRDINNAVTVNCWLNPIVCILGIPFMVIDAVEFISDAVKKEKASEEAEEPKEGEQK